MERPWVNIGFRCEAVGIGLGARQHAAFEPSLGDRDENAFNGIQL